MAVSFFEIIQRMNKLNILHRINIFKQAAKNGLYLGQLPILEYVERHDECTQREVADYMQVSPPSIATSVKRMQKAGLLVKAADKSDLRYNRLTVTEKGREISRECRKDFDKIDAQLFSGFNEQECEQLRGYFERMIANMSAGEFANKTFFSLVAEEKKLFDQQNKEGQNGD
ncbi:MarR family winged helix-turn-helix transcriptional regulator [Acetivibrio cellulolyticus]|uniref:MarR family winged helix-turn-helix transcriptional regulator n=1 Tax=Acetivibrio cellulolyticus TaxID=35830 RepID=UPI0001E2F578|nr:MarR family winged helix-turn-helix transcriptional regulator [Acetivibrio cellulolyticus]